MNHQLELPIHSSSAEPVSLSARADVRRQRVMPTQLASARTELGQFMTPATVADFMASMFSPVSADAVRLLDPGAGIGSLTAAFIQRICQQAARPRYVDITACEVDSCLHTALETTLRECQVIGADHAIEVTYRLKAVDFIDEFTDPVAGGLFSNDDCFTHVITNPPYKKLGSESAHRKMLRSVGIEATNLYAAFVSLAIKLLVPSGELVAITPRSFCNGPYFLPFRRLLLDNMAVQRIHTFGARDLAFKEDDVLQENIIFCARRAPQADLILLSSSHGLDLNAIDQRWAAVSEVFRADDPNLFIHIPVTEADAALIRRMKTLNHSLDSLGISVSTGPVVEFRHDQYIHRQPNERTVPLIYPAHFENGFVRWPKPNGRKRNAIDNNDQTEKWLMPQGCYTLTRRFSSKEERRRIVAAVYDPSHVPGEKVGFENHLNVFHVGGKGLHPSTARGLAVYLNSTPIDQFFRLFNGHTQVNATDLRTLPYPSLKTLNFLGAQIDSDTMPKQEAIDVMVDAIVFNTSQESSASISYDKEPPT